MARLSTMAEHSNRDFDRLFWKRVGAEGRFAAMWEMVSEADKMRGGMGVNPDFVDLLRCLNHAKARYLVVVAYAVAHYTEPRYTKDIDIWVEATGENARRVFDALTEFGAPLKEMGPRDFTNRNIVFQIGVEPNRADIIMKIEGLTFPSAWKNRAVTTYGGERMFILGLKDIMKAKQAAGRSRDRDDLHWLKQAARHRRKRR